MTGETAAAGARRRAPAGEAGRGDSTAETAASGGRRRRAPAGEAGRGDSTAETAASGGRRRRAPAGEAGRGASTAETAQTLDRGLRLLEALADDGRGRSVSELAGGLAVSRPAVYRLVATLEQHGLVSRLEDGRVRLGPGLLALARAVTPALREVAAPLLRRLAEEMGATAHLTVTDPGSDEAVAVAVVEPSRTDLHVAYRVGSRHPLERGAAGRAILSARAGDGFPFVVTEGELQAGAVGIAAPVLGVAGLEASVGLVAMGRSLDPAVAGPRVVATAAALAAALS